MPRIFVHRHTPVLLAAAMLAAATLAACDGGTGPAARGALEVVVSTGGRVLDRDGYAIRVGDGAVMEVPVNGTATVPELKSGAHTVTIAGIADNCTLRGANSRTVTVASGTPTRLNIDVDCVADRFAYYAGINFQAGNGLFVAKLDGSQTVELKRGIEPARLDWSPDGHKILFVRREPFQTTMMVVDVETRDSVWFTSAPGESNIHPTWSPDGSKIAYTGSVPGGNPDFLRLTVMNADGTGRRVVTPAAGSYAELMPAWSPDGSQLAFRRGLSELRVVNLDGTGDRLFATLGDVAYTEIAWSPDGAWIVWNGRETNASSMELWRARPDGTGRAPITNTPNLSEQMPSFLADGRIGYTITAQDDSDAWAINIDGTGATNLTNSARTYERGSVWP